MDVIYKNNDKVAPFILLKFLDTWCYIKSCTYIWLKDITLRKKMYPLAKQLKYAVKVCIKRLWLKYLYVITFCTCKQYKST